MPAKVEWIFTHKREKNETKFQMQIIKSKEKDAPIWFQFIHDSNFPFPIYFIISVGFFLLLLFGLVCVNFLSFFYTFLNTFLCYFIFLRPFWRSIGVFFYNIFMIFVTFYHFFDRKFCRKKKKKAHSFLYRFFYSKNESTVSVLQG